MTDVVHLVLGALGLGALALLAWLVHRQWGWPAVVGLAFTAGAGLAAALLPRPRRPSSSPASITPEAIRLEAEDRAGELEREADALLEESAPRAAVAATAAAELDQEEDVDAWLQRHVDDVRAGRVR